MRVAIVVPARFASSRLPGKPLLRDTGKYLVQHVYEQASRARCASAVIVATDDARIADAVSAFGGWAEMTREDHASGTDRVAEVAARLAVDVVMNVQGDEPLIEPALIDACAALLAQREDCVMSTVAHAMHGAADYTNPNVVKVVLDAHARALLFSRAPLPWWRDGAPAVPSDPPALRHVGLYAYRAGFLRRFPTMPPAPLERTEALEQLRVLWHGERIAVHVTDTAPGPGVDTPQDLERVRRLFALPR